MKTLHAGALLLLAGLTTLTLSAQASHTTAENPTVVLGTYDSRAVAIAYVRSDDFAEYLREQQADLGRLLERARDNGDAALASELDRLGPAMQRRVHEQGFGAAPIDDIIARIEDQLPAIAQAAGVDVIVSRWELDHRGASAASVDLTERIAAAFEPSPKTLESMRQIMAQEPVPLDQLREDH